MIFSDLLPGKQEIIDKLFPSGITPFIVQIIAIALLVIVVFIFLFKPIRKMIKTREDHIAEEIHQAEEKNRTANNFLLNAHEEINSAHIKAQNIMKEAEKNLVKEKEKSLAKINEEIKDMKIRAEEDIKEMRKKADEEIKKEIIDVAFLASEKILERELSKKDNDRIVDDFIETLKEEEK